MSPRLGLLVRVTTLSALLVLMGASGCAGTDPKAAPRSTTGAPPPTGQALPLVERTGVPWRDLGTEATEPFSGIAIVSRTYRVSQTADRVVVVRRLTDGVVVLRHTTGRSDLVPVFADLAGDTLVLVDEDDQSDAEALKDSAHSYIYDLRSGARTALADIDSAPTPSVFGRQATVTDDGRYIYSASVSKAGNQYNNCVALLDLHSMLGSTVECAGGGVNETDGFYVSSGDDGATWLHVQGPTFESCRTGRGLRGRELVAVGPTEGCGTLGTATVAGWSVWSATQRPAGRPVPTVALRAGNGTETIELGAVNGVAVLACGRYAYWRVEDPVTQTIQIRRWRPGMAEVEIVRTMLTPDNVSAAYQLGFGGCADNILTVQEFTHDPLRGQSTVRTLALDS